MKYLLTGISALVLGALSCQVMAGENDKFQVSSVGLGATRVIYPSTGKSVRLSVSNDADHPFLVKSTVLDETQKVAAPFVVTPPLFRLDGGQRNDLTITRTGGNFPDDRESINWLCVQSIPPQADSAWAGGDRDKVTASVQVVPSSCIKLFVRPAAVKGKPVDVADKVSWSVSGKTITATNPTPFYMNISQASFNGKPLKMAKSYIPPLSEEKYLLPGNEVKGTVKWSVIGDYGETQEKTFSVN